MGHNNTEMLRQISAAAQEMLPGEIASERAARLIALNAQQRSLLVRQAPGYARLEVALQLLRGLDGLGFGRGRLTVGVAETCLDIAARTAGPAVVQADVCAEARAWLAVGRRRAGDLTGADAASLQALADLAGGSGCPLAGGLVHQARAGVLTDMYRDVEAHGHAQRAVRLFAAAEDRHREGRARLTLASTLRDLGRPAEALRELERAVHGLEFARDPRLGLVAAFNGVLPALELGAVEVARRLFNAAERGLGADGDIDGARRRWLRGRVEAAEHRGATARLSWSWAIRAFERAGDTYRAALVQLDLVEQELECGRLPRRRLEAALPALAAAGVDILPLASVVSALTRGEASAALAAWVAGRAGLARRRRA